MKPGEIIYQGTSKKGHGYVFRYVQASDVSMMHTYINELSKEKTFITFQGEEISFEEEGKFVTSMLKKMEDKKGFVLLAMVGDKLVGISNLTLKDNVAMHEGVFGISIAKEYRNEGIGKVLLEKILQTAENLPDLKIITLGVFADNPVAKSLYEKFGFKESGRIPKGVLHQGKYVDHVFMYKFVNGFK